MIDKDNYLTVDPEEYTALYLQGREDPSKRYASWDHCFNYFRKAFVDQRLTSLTSTEELQTSCLQLGFYLASWGMYRGKASLLQMSAQALEPVIIAIVEAPKVIWQMDVHLYDEKSIGQLLETAERIRNALPKGSTDTLVTKTMLGIFGNVPAFDRYFRNGIDSYRLNQKSLEKIKKYFDQHRSVFESLRIPTIDFKGENTDYLYTEAKIIDMVFFMYGGASGAG